MSQTLFLFASESVYVLVPLVAVLILLTNRTKTKDYGLRQVITFLAAIALTVLAVTVLKNLIPEMRPLGGELDSFPSRHAATAFAAAFFGAWVYVGRKWNSFIRGWLYVWASVIAIVRVVQQAHFVQDVVAGALIGLAISYSVSKLAIKLGK